MSIEQVRDAPARVYTFTRHPTEAGHDCTSLGDHAGEYVLLTDYRTLAARLARVTEAAREWEKWLVYHGGMAALDDEGVYTKERCIEIFISMAESIRSAALAAPVDAPAEHKGFWVTTPDGNTMHVHGDPNMSEETLSALQHMMELAVKQYAAPTRGPKESE